MTLAQERQSMAVRIAPSWGRQLGSEFDSPYFRQLVEFVRQEYRRGDVYPPGKEIFRAFDVCSFEAVRVVILGQDPYHGPGQANGLCFSVRAGVALPPSLANIFKEVQSDVGGLMPASGDLERWASQGVLLLNATLTVRASSPGSHQNKGWEMFTDAVIRKIASERKHVAFMLWGAYARRKADLIDTAHHLMLTAAHPSPFSADRGFFGCKHFSQANAYLTHTGQLPIVWAAPEGSVR